MENISSPPHQLANIKVHKGPADKTSSKNRSLGEARGEESIINLFSEAKELAFLLCKVHTCSK